MNFINYEMKVAEVTCFYVRLASTHLECVLLVVKKHCDHL